MLMYNFFYNLTISVLQHCYAVITEYSITIDFVRKSTASLRIKISTAQTRALDLSSRVTWNAPNGNRLELDVIGRY